MKKIKHLAVLGLFAALSASAMASGDGLAVAGEVLGTSSYQFRGEQFSRGEPSLGLKVGFAHTSGLHGDFTANTVKFAANAGSSQLHNTLGLGFVKELPHAVWADVGVTRHMFIGSQVRDLSFSELYAALSWQGLSGKLSTVIEGDRLATAGQSRGDAYLELGYSHTLGKYTVGGDVGYAIYDGQHLGAKNGLKAASLRVGYAVNDNLQLQLSHQLDLGEDAFGVKSSGNDKSAVTISYSF